MPFRDNSIFHILRYWVAGARSSLVREMEFRLNFFSGIVRQILWLGAFIFFIETIFQNTTQLAGWDKNEVLIVLALSRLIEGFSDTVFTRNIGRFPELVRTGSFDYLLTKPLPTQILAAFSRITITNIGNLVAGIGLLVYALTISPALPSAGHWIAFGALAIIGVTVYYAILMIIVSFVFFLEQFEAFFAVTHIISEPLTVPFDIFPAATRAALTYLIPLAFIVFVPAQAITGRLTLANALAAFAIAVIFLLLTNLAWRAGLRRYSSASS